MKKYKNDILLMCLLLFATGFSYLYINSFNDGEAEYVKISVNGKDTNLSISEDTTYRIENNDYINVIEIKDKKVRVVETNCPDGICIKQGEIEKNGESIICLPHKVVVSIISDNESDIDAMAE